MIIKIIIMIYNITISMSMDKCARLIVYNLYYQVSDYLRLKAYYIQRLNINFVYKDTIYY